MFKRPTNLTFNVTLIGNSGVGKTALLERWRTDSFIAQHTPTISAASYSRRFGTTNNTVKLECSDTPGQKRYQTIIPLYLRLANAIILVLDAQTLPDEYYTYRT